jgi:hypothetical protein
LENIQNHRNRVRLVKIPEKKCEKKCCGGEKNYAL